MPDPAATTAVVAAPSVFAVVFPFTVLVALGIGIPVGMLALNRVVSWWWHGTPRRAPGRDAPVESGLPVTAGGVEERFSVKFYLVAMLFLVFDVEVAFLWPWMLQFAAGGWAMIGILLAFLVLLEVGYLWLWRKGALDWER